jgi:signal transduction histidine kinase
VSAAARRRRGLRARLSALSVGALLSLTIGVLLLLAAIGIGLALVASIRVSHQRSFLLDQAAPANRAALELENALVNEETGIRGYLITVESQFLEPYGKGRPAEAAAYKTLAAHQRLLGAPVPAELAAARVAARRWQHDFVSRALAEPRRVAARGVAPDARGRRLFDAVRTRLTALHETLEAKVASARSRLNRASTELDALLIFAAVLVLGSVAVAGLILRRAITDPLHRLGADARRVAGGEFHAPLPVPEGPREVRELTEEIEAMRERIAHELAQVDAARERLERQALELSRSNADLEQFAYVASHDLQEPLRKIASFCQALQTRYRGQLDERADQYIDFAVDGAKRMQTLINDLLAFSRVGRAGRQHRPVELDGLLADVRRALTASIEETGARIEADELPAVLGDESLLRSLFQNLLANSLRFHGDQPALVEVSAQRLDGDWEIAVSDNGIGIEPEYAERVFLIFQRLHGRDAYEGSGIGLALCRKIVEYHGGRIWLDTDYEGGASFHFTLPAVGKRHNDDDEARAAEDPAGRGRSG